MSGIDYMRSGKRNHFEIVFGILANFYHAYNLRVNSLCKDSTSRSDVVYNFVKSRSFDFLALEVGHGVHEVEPDATLAQFPDEQLFLL